MLHASIDAFLTRDRRAALAGPVAAILAEDAVELDGTLRYHLNAGFRTVVLFAPDGIAPSPDLAERVHLVRHDVYAETALPDAVNPLIAALPDRWIYWGYNAEYLFFPFCETRSVRELIAFHTEERRDAFFGYAIDLYPADLGLAPGGVDPAQAMLDRSGYYALGREDADDNFRPKERQIDCYGGLRWRFEEHVPWERRRIDRIPLFRARPGLTLRADNTLSDDEMNTYACPWHNNITLVVASFRTAKALRLNPGSRTAIQSFGWRNSVAFDWHSQQLMDLGLMEPGQWF